MHLGEFWGKRRFWEARFGSRDGLVHFVVRLEQDVLACEHTAKGAPPPSASFHAHRREERRLSPLSRACECGRVRCLLCLAADGADDVTDAHLALPPGRRRLDDSPLVRLLQHQPQRRARPKPSKGPCCVCENGQFGIAALEPSFGSNDRERGWVCVFVSNRLLTLPPSRDFAVETRHDGQHLPGLGHDGAHTAHAQLEVVCARALAQRFDFARCAPLGGGSGFWNSYFHLLSRDNGVVSSACQNMISFSLSLSFSLLSAETCLGFGRVCYVSRDDWRATF